MNGLELLEKYSKTAIVVKQWFLEKMLESLKDETLPKTFKEYVRQQEIDNDKIGKLIDGNPRTLFDVLDEHKVYIQIDVHYNGGKILFGSTINNINKETEQLYILRNDAEKSVIEEAFEILNKKL
jgi:polyribonucleotide nucleotidyltransferase